ncbi:ribbon-helix-helix protein, CopG family [Pseudomonas sp. PDM11]|uniref:ribbon-helix-helix protein, CopG family n=1 Tax=Pseudomonas sp. PDM11 TaxID=2769309 RepID=UPI00177E2FA5|nr:ribbon-helix-helix protein, CopG family [Pseudomonas sp. PDM11]MBD9400087.1 ribbon-helix-helix protein, CopG family [Pseudomonas sp. PDM11]
MSLRDGLSASELKARIGERLGRRHNGERLFEQLRASIRQKRHREAVKKETYTFRLSDAEAKALQALAREAKTNRTEIIRRLIRSEPTAAEKLGKIQETNLRAQRDLTLKGRDMEKLAKMAKGLADQNALTLGMALSIMTHHGITWEKPSVAELQLGMAYYHLIKAEMDKLYAEQKKKLKKQLHNLDRSIPRPVKKQPKARPK